MVITSLRGGCIEYRGVPVVQGVVVSEVVRDGAPEGAEVSSIAITAAVSK